MDKIRLSKKAKQIMFQIIGDKYIVKPEDSSSLLELEDCGLIHLTKLSDGTIWSHSVTDFGKSYFTFNPELSNPQIWNDIKWVITTIIAILAIVVSIIINFI